MTEPAPWACPNPAHERSEVVVVNGAYVCPCGITSEHTDQILRRGLAALADEIEEHYMLNVFPTPTGIQRQALARCSEQTVGVPFAAFTAATAREVLDTVRRHASSWRTRPGTTEDAHDH